MTLVVGIKCHDGIVIGADSITTFGSAIEQEVDDKVKIIENDVLVASAGDVGLGQVVIDRLQQNWGDIRACADKTDAKDKISSLIWDAMRPALERAAEASAFFGEELAKSLACNFIVACPLGESHRLIVFDKSALPLEVTFSSPFTSIGSGSFQADPFLAFVKRVYWSNSAPNLLTEGIFCALWTLDHVSRVNAGLGVGGRPNVFTLTRGQDAWMAERVNQHLLGEQLIAIEAAESALRGFNNDSMAKPPVRNYS